MTSSLRGSALVAALLSATSAWAQPDGDLQAALRAAVDGSALSAARTGIFVASVDTGEAVYGHDPDALLNPASNVKLVTTAAALTRLGPEFRFSTELLVDKAPEKGEVKTLWVRGKGDPSVETERLWVLAGELYHLGVRRIGDVVLDDGYFDGERFGPGFDQENSDRAYLAPAGALSLNHNVVEVLVTPSEKVGPPATVELEPASPFFTVENRTVTAAKGAVARVVVTTSIERGKEKVVVTGRVPVGARPHALWRRIDDPTLYFGHTFRALLEARGVKVGRLRTGRTPESAKLYYVWQSDSLGELVRQLNKTSNNFTAEQLLKTLGAEVKGAPGTWSKGVEAAEDVLAEMGIPRGSYVMRNGSGLNDTNRFSARQLVTLLRAMWARFPIQPEYVVSLPVAARDGTIRWRMEGTAAAGRLRAKTGTLDGVVALSGYVQNAAGKTLAFAVMVNDSPGHQEAVKGVDAVGAALAASGGPASDAIAAAAAADVRPASTGVPADVTQRLRTYYALGRAADARNERFLRTALRAETEPALRLAVAECVYLSDRDGDTARRTFLDAIAADPQALARLWQLLPGDAGAPALSSLADLAGEGEADALRLLVDLSGRGIADERLAGAVEDRLAALSASAPEELVATLRAAPADVGALAVTRLLAGLTRSAEKDHPFPAALRAMAARGDAAAEFAATLSARVDAVRPPAAPVKSARGGGK